MVFFVSGSRYTVGLKSADGATYQGACRPRFGYASLMSAEPYIASQNSTDHGADALRIPPHSIQAEQSVLGGLMLENSAWDQVADRVGEHDFYSREHQLIFRAMCALYENNQAIDPITGKPVDEIVPADDGIEADEPEPGDPAEQGTVTRADEERTASLERAPFPPGSEGWHLKEGW